MWRQRDWCVPVPAKGIAGRITRTDTLALTRRRIDAADSTILGLCVHNVRVGRINLGLEAIPSLHVEPLIVRHTTAVECAAWRSPGSIVLEASIDVIREAEVIANFIWLGDWECIDVIPRLASVIR